MNKNASIGQKKIPKKLLFPPFQQPLRQSKIFEDF
jgi:hypothetical protein